MEIREYRVYNQNMIELLATSLNQNDDEPNVKLARSLAESGNTKGIREIVDGLDDKNAGIASDCVKVLYEIGYLRPELIEGYASEFLRAMKSKNNRMVWGACIALAVIAESASEEIYENFEDIFEAYEKGSVITRDNCVSIFAGLIKGNRAYAKKLFPLLISHLENCRPKEVAQHAERIFVCIDKKNSPDFRQALLKRYDSLADSQKKRVDAILKKIDRTFGQA